MVEKLERLVYGKKTGVSAQRGVKFWNKIKKKTTN